MKRFFLLLALLATPGVAGAATRYIDGNLGANCTGNYSFTNRNCTGSDGNAYTTANAGTATAATLAGDILYVRAGTYNLRIDTRSLTINSGTNDTTRVKIAGYPGEAVTLFPLTQTGISCLGVNGKQYVWFDNFICDGTNVTASESTVTTDETSSFIRLSYIESKNNGPVGSDSNFSGAGFLIGGTGHELQHVYSHDNGLNGAACGTAAPYGLYLSAKDTTVEDSRFMNNGTYGIHQYKSGASDRTGNIIRRNEIATNGAARSCGAGAVFSSGSGVKIYGNIFRDQANGGAGVSFDHFQPCINCEFFNNTVVRNAGGGLYIEVNSTGAQVKNNIFEANGTNVVNLPGSTTFAANLCFGTGGTTGCAITGQDPLFDTFAGNLFNLLPGSPAINAGTPSIAPATNIPACSVSVATSCYNGAAPDLGAIESGAPTSGGSPTLTPNPATVAAGAPISVTVDDDDVNERIENVADWVGVYVPGAVSSDDLDWFYMNNSKVAPLAAISDAVLNFTAPSTPGLYEFRFYQNGSGAEIDRLATAGFTVTTQGIVMKFNITALKIGPSVTLKIGTP